MKLTLKELYFQEAPKKQIFAYLPKDVVQNPDLLKRLRKMTFKSGSASGFLNRMEHLPLSDLSKEDRILVAKLGKEIVGWLSMEYAKPHRPGEEDFFDVNIFIQSRYRAMGIGSKLLSKAKQIAGLLPLHVYPHDQKSRWFFKKHEDKVEIL